MSIVGVHNVGKVLELKLAAVGINSLDELRENGTEQAFLKLLEKYNKSTRAVLFSIEGAIEGVRWHNLDAERKAELEVFFQNCFKK